MPADDVGEFGRHGDAGRLHEIDRDQAGDVGDGEFVAGREFAQRQFSVEQDEEVERASACSPRPIRAPAAPPIPSSPGGCGGRPG